MGRGRYRQESQQEPRRPGRDHQSEQPADRGEQHALDEQLLDDAAAGRAEREADRNLLLPRSGARDQQARDVRTRDQQHPADDAQEQPERLRQLLPDRRAALRRVEQIDLALEEFLAGKGGAAERGVEHLLLEDGVKVGCSAPWPARA